MGPLLGLVVLDARFILGDAALMPLLSGLFGISVLLPSIARGSTLPEQQIPALFSPSSEKTTLKELTEERKKIKKLIPRI